MSSSRNKIVAMVGLIASIITIFVFISGLKIPPIPFFNGYVTVKEIENKLKSSKYAKGQKIEFFKNEFKGKRAEFEAMIVDIDPVLENKKATIIERSLPISQCNAMFRSKKDILKIGKRDIFKLDCRLEKFHFETVNYIYEVGILTYVDCKVEEKILINGNNE